MRTENVTKAIAEAVEKIMFSEWHHEGHVIAVGNCTMDLPIDGTTYSVYVCRVPAVNTDGDGNVIHGADRRPGTKDTRSEEKQETVTEET